MLEEQPGGPCGWNRVTEGERGRREDKKGIGLVVQGLVGYREGLGLLPPGR